MISKKDCSKLLMCKERKIEMYLKNVIKHFGLITHHKWVVFKLCCKIGEPDEEGYYIDKHVALAHKRLIVVDPKGRKATND